MILMGFNDDCLWMIFSWFKGYYNDFKWWFLKKGMMIEWWLNDEWKNAFGKGQFSHNEWKNDLGKGQFSLNEWRKI